MGDSPMELADVEPTMVELYVDQDHCVGMGRCEVVEPDVFEIDDDAVSQVIGCGVFTEERAKYVMFECPTGAIKAKAQDDNQEA